MMTLVTQLKPFRTLALATLAAFALTSCNQDDDTSLDVPSTYEFTRDGVSTVNYSGQTERLAMLEQMDTYLKTANTVGEPALDANMLKNMFRNQNSPFSETYGKNLISKCFSPDTAFFLQILDDVALASQSGGTASNGTPGILVDGSDDVSKGYLVDENGVDLAQVFKKGLMGAVFYYQAMDVYLTDERMNTVGNEDFADGKNYTDMEHYFDEAFGYFGVPTDFPNPATIEDGKFWAEYVNKRDKGLYPGINDEISSAFRTGRAAITAKDYEARDAAIQTIMQKWAVVSAASAVDYLNKGLPTSETPLYKRHHGISEAIGFMLALKYHFVDGNSKFPPQYTYSHIENALSIVGPNTNLYNLTDTEIQEAIGHIRMAFPSGEIK